MNGIMTLPSRAAQTGAFVRTINELFLQHKDQLKTAALLMLDLNLKYLNDNYGHEAGDNYIAKAGRIFVEQVPKHTVVSRSQATNSTSSLWL